MYNFFKANSLEVIYVFMYVLLYTFVHTYIMLQSNGETSIIFAQQMLLFLRNVSFCAINSLVDINPQI